jgi:hypothetical protein
MTMFERGSNSGKGTDTLEGYVTVATRMEQARAKYGENLLYRSTVTPVQTGEGAAVFVKTEVYLRKGDTEVFLSDGHGSVGDITSKKSVEKAETFSVGRALAKLGFEVKEGLASREEMEDFQEEETPKAKRNLFSKARATQEDETEEEEDSEETEVESKVGSSILDKMKKAKSKTSVKVTDEGEVLDEDESEEEETTSPLARFKMKKGA